MKWLLNLIYGCLLLLLSPVILWRCLRHRRYRQGWREKLFGRLPVDNADSRPVVWFHAVSVGEVLQLQKVVERFCDQTRDRYRLLITSSTDTGYELAVNRFPKCTVSWFPLDFSWAVSRALRRVQPQMVVLTELELWPNFLMTCRRRNITTALINGRMSDRSFRGYSRIRLLLRPLLSHFKVVAAQTTEYADRLKQLGARDDVTFASGSVKFDGVTCSRSNAETVQLHRLFRIRDADVVLIAGSTQFPEEQSAVDVWKHLRLMFPELRLILVPRHRERFDEVAAMVLSSGCQLVRRSKLSPGDSVPREAVMLLDTIGELSACWGLADIAFVGGSFGKRGGQNMLEPAAYGAAVMFGPNTWNFREIVSQLLNAGAAVCLQQPEDMQPKVRQLLIDADLRKQFGLAAQQFVLSQQGAVERTVTRLVAALSSGDNPEQRPNGCSAKHRFPGLRAA